MLRRRPEPIIVLALLALLCLAGCKGKARERSSEHGSEDVWFVHATDPHIFLSSAHTQPPKDPSGKDPTDKEVKDAKAASDTGAKQEDLDQKALSDMLQSIPSLSEGDRPEFLLLTGDIGVDPCPIAKPAETVADCIKPDPASRKAQIDKTATLLEASTLRDIFLVAGNNDIPLEDSGDAALGYFNDFMDAVQAKIQDDKKDVRLHNLTRCYVTGGNASSCYADIANTPYRLVGLPSYSFKKADKDDADHGGQARQLTAFRQLLDRARQDDKMVLIASHIPEIDDPYQLGKSLYTATAATSPAASSPDAGAATTATSPGSIWKIKQLSDWTNLLAKDPVMAVFAGHLHDSHRETCQQPYSWSTLPDHEAAFQKLYLAAPLSVKNQDTSPIQARGFSLVHLDGGRVDPAFYWYHPRTGRFEPGAHPRHSNREGRWRWIPAFHWLWSLDIIDTSIERLAVLLIAFLAAYLTIVAVWQIPPPDTSLNTKTSGDGQAVNPPPANAGGTNGSAASSPFTNKFGTTVIAGLGGLVAAEIAKTLGSQTPSADIKWYYVVWFILSFFILLVGLNFVRGLMEALRSRIAIVHYPLARYARVPPKSHTKERSPGWAEFWYWWWRMVNWFLSLRVPVLTFLDTFINLIQGKNQTQTSVFTDEIIGQQRNVLRTADAIRRDLNDLIEHKVMAKCYSSSAPLASPPGHQLPTDLPRVRVNISVLSADQTSVYYISRTPGSSRQTFSKHSVAWVCVYTGALRWYKSQYGGTTDKNTVLFDNSGGRIHDEGKFLMLDTYYESRPGADYEAFVMLPVPWPQRDPGTDYQKGAIHISFRKDEEFESIWPRQEDPSHKDGGTNLFYPEPQNNQMLGDWCDAEVRAALRNAIAVLGELLRGFNEAIYKGYIDDNQSSD